MILRDAAPAGSDQAKRSHKYFGRAVRQWMNREAIDPPTDGTLLSQSLYQIACPQARPCAAEAATEAKWRAKAMWLASIGALPGCMLTRADDSGLGGRDVDL